MKAQSRRQRRREERRVRAELREVTRRWLGAARTAKWAFGRIEELTKLLEDERRAKYAEIVVIPDEHVPRGCVRLVQRIR